MPDIIAKIRSAINSSITYRIVIFLSLLLILIMAVNYILASRVKESFLTYQEESLIVYAKTLSRLLSESVPIREAIVNDDRELINGALSTMREDIDVTYIVYYLYNDYEQKMTLLYEDYPSSYTKEDFDFPAKVLDTSGEVTIKELSPKSDESVRILDVTSVMNSKTGEVIGWSRVGVSTAQSLSMANYVTFMAMFSIAAVFVFGFFLAYYIYRSATKPVIEIADSVKKVAAGNLDIEIDESFGGEIGELVESFNQMTQNLRSEKEQNQLIMNRLSETIELINETSGDIYSISAQQSSGATEQASSVYQASSTSKEIAASSNRIAETTEQMASEAKMASKACEQAREEIQEAMAQVTDASNKVDEVANRVVELGEKSQRISGIIDIINEISQHTNLLALNAAIEASGASEAGKRFSVVAKEIRRLAEKTIESTKVVRNLIEEIQTATNSTVMVTEQSMKSAKEVANIISRMDESVQRINSMVDKTLKASTEITLSTRQQTTACEQMVSTIMEVSEVASEVEKGAKETEESVSKLREMSGSLLSLNKERL